MFDTQKARQRRFNREAIQELASGEARCSCGALITDWETYRLPSEGEFPVFDCHSCDKYGEHYLCSRQRDWHRRLGEWERQSLWHKLLTPAPTEGDAP